ncbi:MAG: glycosyltransferase family 2 protein [Candidatus Erginobacter occultus]|nr:glycosyltransferase family 2 protein [Candidatus Erginobacter occultus]
MEERPAISVLVPTRNRNKPLLRLLRELREQTLAPSRFETIVIDNSPDGAAEDLVAREQQESPLRIRCLRQPLPGKSRAMNSGVAEAAGNLLAATDDDCRPAKDWLETILAGFAGAGDDVLCLVGRVLSETGREDYAAVGLDRNRKITHRGLFARLRAGTIGNGSNTAYRKRAFTELGGFLPGFGPGSRLGTGEETEFFDRVLAAGKGIVFLPGSVVCHRPERTEEENRRRERASLRARGAIYALRVTRGDLGAALLLVGRVLAGPPAAAFLYLRRLFPPGRKVPFWYRPDCQAELVYGFAATLLDPRRWN